MHAGLLSDYPSWRKVLIGTGVALTSFFLFSVAGGLIAMACYGINPMAGVTVLGDLADPRVVASLKIIQVLGGGIGLFIVPSLLLAYLFGTGVKRYLSVRRPAHAVSFLTVVLLLLTSVPLINFLADWNSRLSLPGVMAPVEEWMKQSEAEAGQLTDAFLATTTVAGMLLNLVIIAVLPAIGEELLFRGVLQRIMTRMTGNVHAGIVVTAVVFSAIHMQFYGFFPRMLLGIYFGYLLAWSGTIWLPVAAHLVNNAAAVLFAFLLDNGKIQVDPDAIGVQEGGAGIVWISVVLTAGLVYHVYRTEKPVPPSGAGTPGV